MDLDAFRWLLTDDGQRLLGGRRGRRSTSRPARAHAALARVDARTPSDRLAAALTQADAAARGPWPSSATSPRRMYFTPDGLEQATRLPVATHRAARLHGASAPRP